MKPLKILPILEKPKKIKICENARKILENPWKSLKINTTTNIQLQQEKTLNKTWRRNFLVTFLFLFIISLQFLPSFIVCRIRGKSIIVSIVSVSVTSFKLILLWLQSLKGKVLILSFYLNLWIPLPAI